MQRILVAVLLLLLILTVGTFGYMFIEHGSFFDSLYMTVITITTVGYGEIIPLSPAGRMFTIGLLLAGVGLVLYLVGEVTEYMVEGGLKRIMGRKNMEKKVAGLKDHYIVCGFGRIGKVICKNFKENRLPFVIAGKRPGRGAQD